MLFRAPGTSMRFPSSSRHDRNRLACRMSRGAAPRCQLSQKARITEVIRAFAMVGRAEPAGSPLRRTGLARVAPPMSPPVLLPLIALAWSSECFDRLTSTLLVWCSRPDLFTSPCWSPRSLPDGLWATINSPLTSSHALSFACRVLSNVPAGPDSLRI